MLVPEWPNERWSLDVVSDAFTDGCRFRVLAIVDDFSRECLALVADTPAPADELLAKWQGEWKGSFAPLFREYAY